MIKTEREPVHGMKADLTKRQAEMKNDFTLILSLSVWDSLTFFFYSLHQHQSLTGGVNRNSIICVKMPTEFHANYVTAACIQSYTAKLNGYRVQAVRSGQFCVVSGTTGYFQTLLVDLYFPVEI